MLLGMRNTTMSLKKMTGGFCKKFGIQYRWCLRDFLEDDIRFKKFSVLLKHFWWWCDFDFWFLISKTRFYHVEMFIRAYSVYIYTSSNKIFGRCWELMMRYICPVSACKEREYGEVVVSQCRHSSHFNYVYILSLHIHSRSVRVCAHPRNVI